MGICQIHREWERCLINAEFVIVLLSQPDVCDIVRELKSLVYYAIYFIQKAEFRLSTLYECPFENVSLEPDVVLRQCLQLPPMEEPKNTFSCPEEPMKTKRRGNWKRTEITPGLPISGQKSMQCSKFSRYFRIYVVFIPGFLSKPRTVFCGTLENPVREYYTPPGVLSMVL